MPTTLFLSYDPGMAANPTPSAPTVRLIQRALACARSGDAAGARAAAQAGLKGNEAPEIFHALLGSLECQAGNFAAGIRHFHSALEHKPDDIAVRCNLVRALTDSGDMAGALDACPEPLCRTDASRRLLRLRAYLLLHGGEPAAAAAAYRDIVATTPGDFESWNNLGNALAASGESDAGLAAMDKAVALQPRNAPARFNQATTLVQLNRLAEAEAALKTYSRDFPGDEKPRVQLAALAKIQGRDTEALQWLEEAAQLAPQDATLQIRLGIERQFAWQMDGAETAFRNALTLNPSLDEAYVLLALHLELSNQPEGIAPLVQAARAGDIGAGVTHFLAALQCRREGRFEQGLAELDQVPVDLEPVQVAHLRGQCHDRLGHAGQAFEAFAQMNRLQQQDPSEPLRRASEYRTTLTRNRELVTAQWHASWRREAPPTGRAAPVFLVGFPRSGTTLLDTILMGHARVQVLEERPPVAVVERELGGIAALPTLSAADIAGFRDLYFKEAQRWIDLREDALLIDKSPLHLNRVPVIHRLFPEARFVLALRHPLDVLLSCYITNFRLNNAMSCFLELDSAAWLYDQSFGYWEQCRQMMNLDCHTVHYERMVENSNAELRPLFDWLGLEWADKVLDHQRTASGRGLITTASYAQVTEPLYTRAKGRWQRYRPWLEPVIPTLQPWIERHGYTI